MTAVELALVYLPGIVLVGFLVSRVMIWWTDFQDRRAFAGKANLTWRDELCRLSHRSPGGGWGNR